MLEAGRDFVGGRDPGREEDGGPHDPAGAVEGGRIVADVAERPEGVEHLAPPRRFGPLVVLHRLPIGSDLG